MKKKLLGILIIFTFAFATPLLSQGPPNPPVDPSVGGEVVGGGAPIDGGLGILLGFGLVYGIYRYAIYMKTLKTNLEINEHDSFSMTTYTN
jgi:hypothetical protein